MTYHRILLKLSGESLSGEAGSGLDKERLQYYAREIKSVADRGVQIGLVVGGGNIFRGIGGAQSGFDRVSGDYMGMLATLINCLALRSELEQSGLTATILSGFTIDPLCERISRQKAITLLEQGVIVLLAGGTGNPFFTTDSAAALRAVEIKADVLLKGTRVDGVYTSDPEKDPEARRYERLSFAEAYEKKLKIMDLTAFTLCQENDMPVLVFDFGQAGQLLRAVCGETVGTLISNR